jgi:hypothetical protein
MGVGCRFELDVGAEAGVDFEELDAAAPSCAEAAQEGRLTWPSDGAGFGGSANDGQVGVVMLSREKRNESLDLREECIS